MLNPVAAARRALPSVDRLLQSEAVGILIAHYGRPLVTEAIRDLLDSHRGELSDSPPGAIAPFDEHAFVDAETGAGKKRIETENSTGGPS